MILTKEECERLQQQQGEYILPHERDLLDTISALRAENAVVQRELAHANERILLGENFLRNRTAEIAMLTDRYEKLAQDHDKRGHEIESLRGHLRFTVKVISRDGKLADTSELSEWLAAQTAAGGDGE